MGSFYKIVSFRRIIVTKSLSIDDFELENPKTLGGGFSGALVQEFTVGDKSSPEAKALLGNKTYIIKTMEKTQFRGLKEEQETYKRIAENPSYDELTKIYVQSIPMQEPNVVVTQKAAGTRLLAQALLDGDLPKENYNTVTQPTIAHFIKHFIKNQITPKDHYKKSDETELNVALSHVQTQTLGRVIDRLFAFKNGDKFESAKSTVFAKKPIINNVEVENPLLFFIDLCEQKENGLDKFPELRDDTRPTIDPRLKEAILYFLLPRTLAPMPSDPSPTNEMIGGPPNTPNCFDPGEIRVEQFSFPMGKHEGPFAQFFLFIVFQKYTIDLCQETGVLLNILCSENTWKNQMDIHSFESVKERFEAISEGKKLLDEKPFLLLALFFFGYRQFGSDIVYRDQKEDVFADFALFALGMRYIKSVCEHLVQIIQEKWPEQQLLSVINNTENNTQLSLSVSMAFKRAENLEPKLFIENKIENSFL